MSAFSSVALEVEFTPGVWTDVTSYLAYESGAVTIRQGRPTEFDDPGPATMSFALWNDDGRWMPENVTSPLYGLWRKGVRVRWKVTKAGVTYTRFVGWVNAIAPSFPAESTTGSVVTVLATDALGLLAKRRMRSNLTEVSLWRARADSTWCDAYEASGKTSGQIALLTNYSVDSTRGAPGSGYLPDDPALSFSTTNEMSIGGVATSSAARTSKTVTRFQPSPQQLKFHLLGPSHQVPLVGLEGNPAFSLYTSALVTLGHLTVSQAGTLNNLHLIDATGSAILANLGNLPMANWVEIVAYVNGGNPALSDWYMIRSNGTSIGSAAGVGFDIRNVGQAWFPGGYSPAAESSCGGIVALGTTTPINPSEAWVGVDAGSLSGRMTMLSNIVAQLGVTVTQVGTLTGSVTTGRWSGRSALEVAQEMVRTHSGMIWARSRDSVVHAIGLDQLWPASPVATIDTDADCIGSPRLIDGSEARPTRIDVDWPGGVTSVVDVAAENAGESNSRHMATVAPTPAIAGVAGVEAFGRIVTSSGTRISQVEVDLLSGATDHTATLFSEATTLGGLYPTQRIRLTVPASHFGTSTRDAYVQGWVETYSPSRATVTIDTSPTPTGRFVTTLIVTSGSATIVSSAPAFLPEDVGKLITGPGIPDGSTIETYISDTQVTISSPATQTGSGVWGVISSQAIAVDWWGAADGAAWSPRWVPGSTATGGSATVQGLRGRITCGTVAGVGVVRRLSGVTFTNGEIVCSVMLGAAHGYAIVGYRSDAGTASVNTYYCRISATGDGLRIGKSVSSSPSVLGTWAVSLTPGLLYRVRVRAVGTQHRARLWQASQPEPSGWNITVTDASHSAGALNLQGSNGPSSTGGYVEFDDYLVTKES